jgi:hypothetical protein
MIWCFRKEKKLDLGNIVQVFLLKYFQSCRPILKFSLCDVLVQPHFYKVTMACKGGLIHTLLYKCLIPSVD